jgi:hypothetical protein
MQLKSLTSLVCTPFVSGTGKEIHMHISEALYLLITFMSIVLIHLRFTYQMCRAKLYNSLVLHYLSCLKIIVSAAVCPFGF